LPVHAALGYVVENVLLGHPVVAAGAGDVFEFLHGNAFFAGNGQYQR
jgi:hypothetical protein